MLGRQKESFNVWVIGDFQVGNNGDIIPDDAREYVCVQELLTENIKPPEVILPFKKEALNGTLASLKDTIQENLMGAVVAVGKN